MQTFNIDKYSEYKLEGSLASRKYNYVFTVIMYYL